jgi:hypothetical protein
MKDDFLGEIKRTEGDVIDGVATIRYGSRDIKIHIIRDDQIFEATVKLASEVVSRLEELDKAARRIAAAGLRQIYNHGWNEYDEVQADGSLKAVSNPQLSEAEFDRKLSLSAVNVTGNRIIEFFYDDSGMFWGHCVVVNSLKGIDFSEASATLFG